MDAATGKEQRRLTDAAGDVSFLRFSPDGRRLLTMRTGDAAVVRLLDAVSGKEERQWTLLPGGGPFAFSPDGRLLAITNATTPPESAERTFHVWDTAAKEDCSFKAKQHARVTRLAFSPDNRMLAWGDFEGTITLWDHSAGQIRRQMRGQNASILSLAFSADGKRLASGNGDTTILIWDAIGRPAAARTGKLSADELRALWDDLANKDAAKAFDAIATLIAAPDQAVSLLQAKMRPAPAPIDQEQMIKLIADLDSDEFAVRRKAVAQLRQLGERAEPGLRQAQKAKRTLEARKRIEELLAGIRTSVASPERLRELRAVEVLEHLGSREARRVLQTLAAGASHARLTCEAKAALQRLERFAGSRSD